MKRLIYALFLVFAVSMVSCTEQSLNDETVQTEPEDSNNSGGDQPTAPEDGEG